MTRRARGPDAAPETDGVLLFDAERDELPDLSAFDWVINTIGIIKPYIHDDNPAEVERAINVNAFLPARLAEASAKTGARVIQVATDCVFSGRDGQYAEASPHDATDVYGKTKGLGELTSPGFLHLRCSLVGPEVNGFMELLCWFLGQPRGAEVRGFTNHMWNGVTTLHFAKICAGIIERDLAPPCGQHVVPANDISKAELLRLFARIYHRDDIVVRDVQATPPIDRRLLTNQPAVNRELWLAAGYDAPPTIEAMVEELGSYTLAVG